MRHVTPSVDESRAIEILNRGWLARWRRLSSARFDDATSPSRPAELIWMPCFLVRIPLKSSQGDTEVTCSVDGCSGAFALFQMDEAIADGAAQDEAFPPLHDEAEAEALARAALVKVILRRRGSAGKPTPGPTQSIELLQYPYWVYYYRRRRGLLDIQVLDAATGQRAGQKIKLGVLEAFRRAAP